MQKLSLHLAFHHHQPVGNLPEVLDSIYVECYRPLLEAIVAGPGVRVHMSYSGPLLRYLERAHPEYLDLLRRLVHEERLEFLATGFYEPVLAAIPEGDRRGQLEMSCRWIEERFGVRPRGAWVAEGVWDTALASTFRAVGLEYTILRGQRFLQAGVSPSRLHGHFFTEHFGDRLAVLPGDIGLAELVPFGGLPEVMNYLRRAANRGGMPQLTFADVAERWGAWPGTREALAGSGFVGGFFRELEAAGSWVRTELISRSLAGRDSQGRCYLPGGAGLEAGAWSLPDEARTGFYEARKQLLLRHDAERFLPFLRAGCWEAFRALYGEAHLMSQKGLWLRRRWEEAGGGDGVVRDWLWQAQCNTAYWHGSSGGIYLPHLREAVWGRLLAAQRRLSAGQERLRAEETDYDADGVGELLVYNREVSWVLAPAAGGGCVECSVLPALANWGNTLTRRREWPPIDSPVEPGGTEDVPGPVDGYERHWFHDHFWGRQVSVEELAQNRQREHGDFHAHPYRLLSWKQDPDGGVEAVLERAGVVEQAGVPHGMRVRKRYHWSRGGRMLVLNYDLVHEGPVPLDTVMAVELNLFPSADAARGGVRLEGGAEHGWRDSWYEGGVRQMEFTPGGEGARWSVWMSRPASLWGFPLTSRNPGGEPLYQGTHLALGWPQRLESGEGAGWHLRLELLEAPEKSID